MSIRRFSRTRGAADRHYRRTSCGVESRLDITTINSKPAKDYPITPAALLNAASNRSFSPRFYVLDDALNLLAADCARPPDGPLTRIGAHFIRPLTSVVARKKETAAANRGGASPRSRKTSRRERDLLTGRGSPRAGSAARAHQVPLARADRSCRDRLRPYRC